MTDHGHSQAPHQAAPVDGELDLRGVIGFTLWLGGGVALAMLMVWFLLGGFLGSARRSDPQAGPLAREVQAMAEQGPPLPRLQSHPTADMKILRAHEDAILRGYGWMDAGRTVARVPADRAIELMVARGSAGPLTGVTP